MNAAKTSCCRPRTQRQSGVYAIEFAFAFVIFFVVIYATLAYGIVLTLRQSLQYAAEEGVRAGLRYPAGGGSDQVSARITAAVAEARNRVWLSASVPSAYICPRDVDCETVTSSCAVAVCQVMVKVSYNYGAAPLMPSLPGMGLLLPETLTGKASVLLSNGALKL